MKLIRYITALYIYTLLQPDSQIIITPQMHMRKLRKANLCWKNEGVETEIVFEVDFYFQNSQLWMEQVHTSI